MKISKPSPPAIVTSVMPAASAVRRPVHHDSRSAQLTYVNGIPTNPVQIEISRNRHHRRHRSVRLTATTTRAVSYTHLDVYKRQVVAGGPLPVRTMDAC